MCSALVSAHGLIKERDIFMCCVLVSVHGLKNKRYSCVARLFRFKHERTGCYAYRSRNIQVMAFVLRCRFQWLTNRLTTFPFVPMVPMVPIDHSFSH